MPLDFPSSPADGQAYSFAGRDFVWNAAAGVWKLASSPPGGAAIDFPSTGLVNGQVYSSGGRNFRWLATAAVWIALASTLATTNFMLNPSAFGYADATNTGCPVLDASLTRVPEDVTSGPGWAWNTTWGYVQITGVNAVFENYIVNGGADIEADGVIMRNCHLKGRAAPDNDGWLIGVRHAQNYTIEHCTLHGFDKTTSRMRYIIKSIYGDEDGGLIQYNNIYNGGIGINHDSGTVFMNFVHDMGLDTGDHTNCFMSNGGTQVLLVQKNTFQNEYGQTGGVSLYVDSGNLSNKTIDNNLIAGGGYTLYGGSSGDAAGSGAVPSNIHVTNNRFSNLFYPLVPESSGANGPWAYFEPDPPRTGNLWTGNVWDATNVIIPSP